MAFSCQKTTQHWQGFPLLSQDRVYPRDNHEVTVGHCYPILALDNHEITKSETWPNPGLSLNFNGPQNTLTCRQLGQNSDARG